MQGHGAQRREVLGREEPRQCLLDARFRIHETARDPLAQRVRAEVDEPDLVGAVQQPVGERLADVDAREREDAIAQALQVLDVDRRPDLDPALEQVLDILVAFAPSCARSVRMGQLVDTGDRRAPFHDPLDVGLARGPAAALRDDAGRHLDPARALLRTGAAVRLEVADHEVDALVHGEPGIAEHLVGLAHARGRAQVDAQLPARPSGDITERV